MSIIDKEGILFRGIKLDWYLLTFYGCLLISVIAHIDLIIELSLMGIIYWSRTKHYKITSKIEELMQPEKIYQIETKKNKRG